MHIGGEPGKLCVLNWPFSGKCRLTGSRLKVMTSDVGDGRCYHQLYLPVMQDIVPVYFSF